MAHPTQKHTRKGIRRSQTSPLHGTTYTLRSGNTTLDIYPREMSAYVRQKTCIRMFIVVLFIYSQKLEPAQMPIDSDMDKHIVFSSYKGTLLCNQHNKSLVHTTQTNFTDMMLSVEQKKPATKEYIIYNSICVKPKNTQSQLLGIKIRKMVDYTQFHSYVKLLWTMH